VAESRGTCGGRGAKQPRSGGTGEANEREKSGARDKEGEGPSRPPQSLQASTSGTPPPPRNEKGKTKETAPPKKDKEIGNHDDGRKHAVTIKKAEEGALFQKKWTAAKKHAGKRKIKTSAQRKQAGQMRGGPKDKKRRQEDQEGGVPTSAKHPTFFAMCE